MCPVSVLLLLQEIYLKTQPEVQNLKRDIINLKGQLYHTLTHQKELISSCSTSEPFKGLQEND